MLEITACFYLSFLNHGDSLSKRWVYAVGAFIFAFQATWQYKESRNHSNFNRLSQINMLSGGTRPMATHGEFDEQVIAQELAILREWDYIQQSLLSLALTHSVPHSPAPSRRTLIEKRITRLTQGCAQIRWEDNDQKNTILRTRLIEIRYRQIHYGMLELAPGYLVSHLLPDIPQHLAHLCALLLTLAEHEELLQHQLKELSPVYDVEAMKALTRRERDVLQGLVKGESESEMARRLNVTPTTIHTHLQRLYHRLEVHSAQQAVLRSFALRILNWLNLPW